MNRIRYIYEIINFLAASKKPVKLQEIQSYLQERDDYDEITLRRTKQYMEDIKKNFDDPLKTTQGRDGGYELSDRAKDSIMKISIDSLDIEDRNALNDALEIALRSASFHYIKELVHARSKLYSQKNLKDNDYEFYIGHPRQESKSKLLYTLKDAMNDDKWVNVRTKYDYYGIKAGINKLVPLFILHDSDETFIVFRDGDYNYHYMNIMNITKVSVLRQSFIRHDSMDKLPRKHVTDGSIIVKRISIIKLKINKDWGWSTFDLWHHECKVTKRTKNTLEVEFFEDYLAAQFLFLMSEFAEITYLDPRFKKYWQHKISFIK